MSKWADALEQEARRLAIMRAVPFTMAARCIRDAVKLGVSTRHEAALVLAAVGLGDDVVRVLGEDASVAREGDSPLDSVLTAASEHVATWPEWKHSDDVKRRREEFRKRCERLGVRAATPSRYIGEFGDIDEPSVGDVDGYGRRG